MTTLDISTTPTISKPKSRFTLKTEAERFALVAAWLLLIAIFGFLMPDSFLSWRSFSTLFGSQAILVVLTLAIILPLTSGDFDLSGASTLTMSCMLIAVLNVKLGWPIVPVLAVAGGRDVIHPPATVRQTAARLSGTVSVFPEMSHWLPGEPGYLDVAAACLDWIAEQGL